MSNNIDQKKLSTLEDSTNAKNDIGKNDYFWCTSCIVQSFFTYCGLNQHVRTVWETQEIVNEEYTNIRLGEQNIKYKKLKIHMDVSPFGKKDLFMLPTSRATVKYIIETTKLMNIWKDNSPFKDIAFKVIHIMPRLLLQKLSKAFKAKDHLKVLEKTIDLWKHGKIAETIESRFHHINTPESIGELSKRFALLMEKENVNDASKLSSSNMYNHGGIKKKGKQPQKTTLFWQIVLSIREL